MPINPVVQQGLLTALQNGALGQIPNPAMQNLVAKTPEEQDKPGFFDRMFPKRDPNTGEQGGVLANPLFRIGMNLLARSGPQARPTSLGQVIAGSIGDYAEQRNNEDAAASNFMQLSKQRQQWGDEQGKRTWAEGLDPEALLALGNPTGNPEAVKAQVQGPLGTPRLGPIPKGYATYAPIITQAEQQNPALPKGLLPAILETESTFNPNAVGPNVTQGGKTWNAKGIAQFAPETAARYGIDPMNPEQAIPTAAIYLREELQRSGGDLDKALAIYGGGFVNGKITPNGRAYVEKVKARMAKYAGGGALPGSPPPPPPAQFSGSGLSMPGAETPGYPAQPPVASPVQPQVAPPQSPAVQPQGGAPLPAQTETAPPVSGPSLAPAGEPTPEAPVVPPLQFDEKGRPTKSSILEALKALPIENRNQLITGAWLKAAGNKKEFAEHLGTALLAQGQRSTSDEFGFKSPTTYQQVDMIDQTTGRKFKGSYNPRNGQVYEPDGKGGLTLAPPTSVPTTAGALAPLSQTQFDKLANQITEDEIGLQKLDNYVKNIAGTNVGLNRWADAISQHFKTLIGGRENGLKLTEQELNRAIAKGDLEALVGLFRLDIVGPGVMTAQDALFIKEALGSDVGVLQNPEVVKERLKLMIEQKAKRMQPNIDSFNRNAIYYGAKPKILDIPDTKKWDLYPNMRPSNPNKSAAPVKSNIKSITKVSE